MIRILGTILFLTSGTAFAGELDGIWQGSYAYPDNSQRDVPFELAACQSGADFKGETSEPNTFGDASAKTLGAKVNGTAEGAKIQFVKTYDGSGGVKHSILYTGELQDQKIRGTWRIGDDYSGTFEMARKTAAGPESSCETSLILD